jgi:hypothetical protein
MNRWSKEEDEIIRNQYVNGQLGIVRKLADLLKRTRNQVIGRANRLGLSRAKESWKPDRPPRIQRQQQKSEGGVIYMQHKSRVSDIPYDQLWTWAAERTHLVDIKEHQCRWPVGEMEFCGGDKVDGNAYCAVHCRFAYTKSIPALRTEPFFKVAGIR